MTGAESRRLSTVDLEAFVRSSDVRATRAAYASYVPYVCDCSYCRNFQAQSDLVPPEVRSLLERMGIDPMKLSEVCEFGRSDGGGRLYQAECPFPGQR